MPPKKKVMQYPEYIKDREQKRKVNKEVHPVRKILKGIARKLRVSGRGR